MVDIVQLQEWIGRSETRQDVVTAVPMAALAATLDRADAPPQPGDLLPPLWHWLYFLATDRQSALGSDGHAQRGGFLPPVALPRRMWAGGRLEFHRPLRVGEAVTRVSRIIDIKLKQGRTGSLAFVVVRHEISNASGLALTEAHDIVYRAQPQPGEAAPSPIAAPLDHDWERFIHPDDVLLFRYSALTFNGHRIHYDRRYATEVEGYPGLVVHGPLVATLMLDLLHRSLPEASVARFEFRSVTPLFDTAPFSVCGKCGRDRVIRMWAQNSSGDLAMDAQVSLA